MLIDFLYGFQPLLTDHYYLQLNRTWAPFLIELFQIYTSKHLIKLMKCRWTKAWPMTSCSACDLWPHQGPTGQWKTYFGFLASMKKEERIAHVQPVSKWCVEGERTERIQVVLLILWGSLETKWPSYLARLAGGTQLASCRCCRSRLHCGASLPLKCPLPQLTSSSSL